MLYAGIGSRETPENILNLMQNIAVELKKLGYRLCSGGTGQAIRAAIANNIPVFNLQHTGAISGISSYLVEKGIIR